MCRQMPYNNLLIIFPLFLLPIFIFSADIFANFVLVCHLACRHLTNFFMVKKEEIPEFAIANS